MDKPKVAILGPGSIGRFHAREFLNCGCDVVAILTRSKKSAEKRAVELRELYGIKAQTYWDLEKLLDEEELDMVSVCSPSRSHAEYVRKCLEKGLHVLCEKPFVLGSEQGNYETARELLELAKEKDRILAVNTQLVSILDSLPRDFNLNHVDSFSMYMEPNMGGVINLVAEAVPHMNSLLIRLRGEKDVENIKFPLALNDELKIDFKYGECKVEYKFRLKKEGPRKFNFSINGVEFDRETEEGSHRNYHAWIVYDKGKFEIEDPLKVSIHKFVSAARGEGNPLVGERDILQNVKLQDLIIQEYQDSL